MSLSSLFAVASVLLPQAAAPSSSGSAARPPSDSALVATARERPDVVRDTIAKSLALAVAPLPDSSRAARLAAARRLSRAYAAAWSDSFLLRQVVLFEGWPQHRRVAKVEADSLRRAGIEMVGRLGTPAAMRLWREALRRAAAADDTAGWAAAMGSVGGGWYLSGRFDSATVYLERARDLAERLGDYRTLGTAVGMLASVSKDRGDLRRAQQLYARALEIRARSGDTRGIAADENNLGLIAQTLGDLEEAQRRFEGALALNRRGGRDRPAAVNLTNLANVATVTADYALGAKLYREALAMYRATGDRVDAAFVLHNLARLELRRGDYPAATAALSESLRTYEAAGMVVEAAAVHRDLAAVRAAAGDLQAALTGLRLAERQVRAVGASRVLVAGLALTRADIAVELNELAEAELQYARAARLYRAARYTTGQAEAQQGRGLLHLLRKDYRQALQALTLAVRVQLASGDPRSAALTRLYIGHAQRQQGDTAAARRTLTNAFTDLRRLRDVVGEAAALNALADMAAANGAPLAAESFYREGLARLGGRPAPEVRWRLHAGLGEALRSRGATADAARELRTAVNEIERVAGTLRLEERRGGFLADKWDVYAQLALTEHALRRDAEAFAVSERLRARQMLDLVTRGRVARAAGLADGPREREQDLRRQIAVLSRALEAESPEDTALRGGTVESRPMHAAREALDRAQRAYADLLVEMRESDTEHVGIVSGEIVPWRRVAARLRADDALIEYLLTDSASLAFVVTADTVTALDLPVDLNELRSLVEFTRGVLSRPDVGRTAGLWRAPLRRLYSHLVEPIEHAGLLRGKRRLIIAPHGELHYLAFGALMPPTGSDRFLIEQFRVTQTPSASLWVRLAERSPAVHPEGVLALAPRAGMLPASRREVASVARIHGTRASALLGADASERAFRAAAPQHGIIHLASYGVLNKHNPLFSFVELGGRPAAPMGPEDGRLEVHEVFGLSLRARLVVLSACQTALGSGALADVPPGDDWVGLVRAFLSAGARNVVATLWRVEDEATARLMERFHQQLASGAPIDEALATAQRSTLRDPRTAHPFYWAGFVVTGAD